MGPGREAVVSASGLSRPGRPRLRRNPFLPGQSPSRTLEVNWPFCSNVSFFLSVPVSTRRRPQITFGFYKTRRFVASNSPCCHFPCAVFSMSGTNSKWPDGSVCSRLGSKISRKPKVSGDRDSLPLRDFSERVAVLFFPVGPWRLQPFGVPKGGPTGHAGARRPTVQYKLIRPK